MTETQTLKTLQLFYAGQLVDAVRQYHNFGVLGAVVERKRLEQELAAPDQLSRLGIATPEALFSTFSGIFGCADWKLAAEGGALRATTRTCLACGLAKRLGAPSPCAISCINPFTALAKALPSPQVLKAEETLWEGERCLFSLTPA